MSKTKNSILSEIDLDLIEKRLSKTFTSKTDLKDFAKKEDLENFATKDDLKDFAKKEDLINFATKDDLKNFATKSDLKNFATKDDLRFAVESIIDYSDNTFATKNDLYQLKSDIFEKLDEFVQEIRDNREERTVLAKQVSRISDKVEKIELNITTQ